MPVQLEFRRIDRETNNLGSAAVLLAGLMSSATAAQAGVENFIFSLAARASPVTSHAGRPASMIGKSMDFVDSCYLIKHSQGWFLRDTGIPDAVAATPNGLTPADRKSRQGPARHPEDGAGVLRLALWRR
jgi:hypothetical protein